MSSTGCSRTLSIRPRLLALSASKNLSRSSSFSAKETRMTVVKDGMEQPTDGLGRLTRMFDIEMVDHALQFQYLLRVNHNIGRLTLGREYGDGCLCISSPGNYLHAARRLMDHDSPRERERRTALSVVRISSPEPHEFGNEWRRPWVPDVNRSDA